MRRSKTSSSCLGKSISRILRESDNSLTALADCQCGPRPCPVVEGVQPYGAFSLIYDELLGDRFFTELRRTFQWMIRRYSVQFEAVADVACGTGTFVRYLCDIGAQPVYGVDCSPTMLRRAVRKNSGNGARFLLQDLRALRLPRPVDLVTCNFDSLNYLRTAADLRGAFRRFAQNLGPDGHAIFDVVTERSTEQGRGLKIERVRGQGQAVIRMTRRDAVRRLQVARLYLRRAGSGICETHVQRAYTIPEVVAALGGSGLRLRAVHDFHNPCGPPWRAERAVYLVRRADIYRVREMILPRNDSEPLTGDSHQHRAGLRWSPA
jgi:SAM-dependent methyltransferase